MAQSHRIVKAKRQNKSNNITLSQSFAANDNLVGVCGHTKIIS